MGYQASRLVLLAQIRKYPGVFTWCQVDHVSVSRIFHWASLVQHCKHWAIFRIVRRLVSCKMRREKWKQCRIFASEKSGGKQPWSHGNTSTVPHVLGCRRYLQINPNTSYLKISKVLTIWWTIKSEKQTLNHGARCHGNIPQHECFFYIIEISNNLNISIKHIMYIDIKIIESLFQSIITSHKPKNYQFINRRITWLISIDKLIFHNSTSHTGRYASLILLLLLLQGDYKPLLPISTTNVYYSMTGFMLS